MRKFFRLLIVNPFSGGPSGRRFSGLYYSGINEWHSFQYKNLTLSQKPVVEVPSKDEL
jgi:acyl-homoserine lactone acylase PvdQ